MDDHLLPGQTYGPVIRDLCIVECCTGGAGAVSVNGVRFPVRPGDCYILLPGDRVIHYADENTPREGVWCAIDGMRLVATLRRAGIRSDAPFAPKEAFSEIDRQIRFAIAIKDDRGPSAALQRTACVYRMLAALFCGKDEPEGGCRTAVDRAIAIMETEYHTALPVAKIAARVGFERSYFSVLFREATGLSPHAYLTALRVRKAAALLEAGEESVESAAASVGMEESSFYRAFRATLGITPSEYKKMHREKSRRTKN